MRTACISLVVMGFLLVPVALVRGQNPDFAISANPTSLCVNPGINAVSTVTVSSVGGFSGTVLLSSSVDPSAGSAPTLSGIPSSEALASGQSVSFDLSISTTTSTPLYVYTIAVTGYVQNTLLFHQAVIQLAVSSGCSVGGTILPVDRMSLISPFLTAGAFAVAIIGLAATVVVYRARRK